MLISPEYLALQKEIHSRGNYGVMAAKWAKLVAVQAEQIDARSVLDYGCGPGLLAKSLPMAWERRYEVFEYDPAVDGKNVPPEPADLVFCGDVLEHIEPVFLEAVLDDLRRLTKKLAMLVVATRPAEKHLADGRNAHLIIEPAHWWMRRFHERWRPGVFAGDVDQFQYVGLPQ